jgi:ATP-dependent DNA helicase RecQ
MEEVEGSLLPQLFGHKTFRPGQREIVRRVLSGESCLAVLPTGAGKSLLYMLPSQLLDGITLVVSPLLALMRDQVEALRAQDILAVRLDSSMTFEEYRESIQDIVAGKVKVLFVSPERFNNEAFKRLLGTVNVAMFVVDEAHCISEWGHAFRPDYLRLAHFASVSKAHVRLALTATATKRVAHDILERLGIDAQNAVRLPSVRTNLALYVQRFEYPKDSYEERLKYLLEVLPSIIENGAAIIYVSRQKLAERLAADLVSKRLNAKAYHGGMDTEQREAVESWFLSRDGGANKNAPIVVGTTAFGMGIDKSDIRAVVHFDLPRSVEECKTLLPTARN